MTNTLRIRHVRSALLPAILLVQMMPATLSGQALTQHVSNSVVADSAAVAHVVNSYHAALSAGDSTGALAFLAQDVMILESGGVETRAEYRSYHLAGDIAFAKGVTGVRAPLKIQVVGDIAWTAGTSTTRGQYKSRSINSVGAESMVLSRTKDGWRIRSIHWSSRNKASR